MSTEEQKRIADSLATIAQLLDYHLAPPKPEQLANGRCWRWEATAFGGRLRPLAKPDSIPLTQLIGLQEQIQAVEQNTRLFLKGREANHVLLTGNRGCGKSSLVRGIFNKYTRQGLRLIETDAEGLATLPTLSAVIKERSEKFILYCDDLSFSENNHLFNRIKSSIEGALSATANNLLIYATSNRRHIIAEQYSDNDVLLNEDGDIHPLETLNEKISLSDRFGLRLSFELPDVAHYEAIVAHWLKNFRITPTKKLLEESRRFADLSGSRNGRTARQYAVIVAGRR